MNKNLTCNQVVSLLELYITGEINQKLNLYVDEHIKTCSHCKQKLEDLKSILYKFESVDKNISQGAKDEYSDSKFLMNLSAYIDNELESDENIKIKKITVSNPKARKKLESMYKFQKLLQASYEKTKHDYKTDFSKAVMSQVIDRNDTYTTLCFQRLILLFISIVIAIIIGFLYLYL